MARGLDLVAPVLAAAWAMGRLLGPQLMVAGGGHPHHQWFGMYYATQAGKRLPVPIFQAVEDFTIFLVLILLERRLDRWPDGSAARRATRLAPSSAPAWCCGGSSAPLDQRLWLAYPDNLGSALVQVAGVGARRRRRRRAGGHLPPRWRAWQAAGAPGGRPETTGAAPRRLGRRHRHSRRHQRSPERDGAGPRLPGTGAGGEELSGADP